MEWIYNHTSKLYQGRFDDCFVSVDSHLNRFTEENGWLPLRGIALGRVWTEKEWTCQERIEYDTITKVYQVGTRKWRDVKDGLEFQWYQDVAIRLLRYQKLFEEKRLPRRTRQNIADLFKEVGERLN